MNVLRSFSLLLILAISTATSSLAFETDQYNLPPVPLADIGDEVSRYVEENLRAAAAAVNTQITRSLKCIEAKTRGCGSAEAERKNLAELRSDRAIADALFKLIGDGNLFTTRFGNWMRSHKFRGQPDRYKAPLNQSIFILNPANYLTLSATVKLFGAEFGIDKLEHFFQQGHQYYEIEREELAKGKMPTEAEQKAISWGKKTERTYFGTFSSGVYSNADLYANYAGMKFYNGLTHPLQINGMSRPPIMELRDGVWRIADMTLRENLIKPFLTDHLNEALNPSSFRLTLVRSVRREVKEHACPDWVKRFPTLTREDYGARRKSLESWNSEAYGYTRRSRTVTIDETCFSSK